MGDEVQRYAVTSGMMSLCIWLMAADMQTRFVRSVRRAGRIGASIIDPPIVGHG